MLQTVLVVLLMFVYGGMAAYVWGFWQNRPHEQYPVRLEWLVLTGALVLHTWLVFYPVWQLGALYFGFGFALNLVLWLMVLFYWVGSVYYTLKGLQILLLPLVVIGLPLATFFPGPSVPVPLMMPGFILHLASSILAYSLFGTATLFAVLIILFERDLRRRKFSPLMRFLPSLLSLEKIMFQGLGVGFFFLSISVASGLFFSEAVFGVAFQWSHKSIFGILSWLIYAALILMHRMYAWRGKKAAWWLIIGFMSLMFAYIGSKFVLALWQ